MTATSTTYGYGAVRSTASQQPSPRHLYNQVSNLRLNPKYLGQHLLISHYFLPKHFYPSIWPFLISIMGPRLSPGMRCTSFLISRVALRLSPGMRRTQATPSSAITWHLTGLHPFLPPALPPTWHLMPRCAKLYPSNAKAYCWS